jgi:hypothetical protein
MPIPPTTIHFRKILVLSSCRSYFKKVYIDSPRGFYLGASVLYISCFNQIFPHYIHFFYHLAPLIFNGLWYIISYSIHIQMSCFNIFHILTFSFPLQPYVFPSDRPTNTVLISLSLHIYVYMCVCIHITYKSSFHI